MRQAIEGFAGSFEDLPLVHEWVYPEDKVKMLPDEVSRGGFPTVLYRYYQDEEKTHWVSTPVQEDVYRRFCALFDPPFPWKEDFREVT
jgi:hypothetical protein